MHLIENCPLCGSQQIHLFLLTKDYFNSLEAFQIQKCENCNFKFTSPRPDIADIYNYYQSDDYISHSNRALNPIQIAYKLVRKITINQKAKIIKNKTNGIKLLDVGCGTGHFLQKMISLNYDADGIEVDKSARGIATNVTDKEIFKNINLIPPDRYYNVITLWHVLEHFHDFKSSIKQLLHHLSSDGTLIIAVPNCNSKDAEYYNQYWAAYDLPRHLSHFTPDTIKKLFDICNLKLIEIIPQYFDAFYVSLLSEKYKLKANNQYSILGPYLKGLQNGFRSNKAAKNNCNYSSLIYIAKK
jgi:2-polyprenyl-3-methyl-5-hydroxy-6-metoxy-1,4-benzoquinol methylase